MSEAYRMIGYIREGPRALQKTLESGEDAVSALVSAARKAAVDRIFLTGIGSSYTASLMAAPLWVSHAGASVHVVESSEFGLLPRRVLGPRSLVIAVSRSGERGLVVNALDAAREAGCLCAAMTGSPQSLLSQRAPIRLCTAEGPEITFPKTKSVLATAGLLMRAALAMADPGDTLAKERLERLRGIPEELQRRIGSQESQLTEAISGLARSQLVAFAGTASNYGAAMEGAMKLQESSYMPSCGNSTDGLLNGPVGAMDARWLLVALVTPYDIELNRSLLQISHANGARAMVLGETGLQLDPRPAAFLPVGDRADPFLSALQCLPPLQMLAYLWTVERGMNPDAPTSMMPILDAILPPGRAEPELRGTGP